MAAKFKIEQNPTFASKVGIHRAGGEMIEVGMTFKYRTRTEQAELTDTWKARREDAAKEFEGQNSGLRDVVGAMVEVEVQEIADIVEGWEFDDAVSDDAIRRLLDGGKSIYDAIMKSYFDGLDPARLGN